MKKYTKDEAKSAIAQIKINPTFNFGGKTVNLKGDAISPLANKYALEWV